MHLFHRFSMLYAIYLSLLTGIVSFYSMIKAMQYFQLNTLKGLSVKPSISKGMSYNNLYCLET